MIRETAEGGTHSEARDKFDELRLCVAAWERRMGGANHPLQRLCRDGAFAFRQISQDALFVEAAAAVVAGNLEKATDLLDVLAGVDPDHWVFGLGKVESAAAMPPHLTVCRDFLVRRSKDAAWIKASGANDLRALVGLHLFVGGAQLDGLALLDGVHWERIRLATYFLQKITMLYWSGAADVVAAYMKGLAPLFLDPTALDWGSRILGGVFGGYSGDHDFAGAVLEPFLPFVLDQPELLFQVMDGLLFAGRGETVAAFFRALPQRAALEKQFDRELRLRFHSLLFASGCYLEAGQGFADLAASHEARQLVELSRIIYGLVLTGQGEQASRLVQAALEEQGETVANLDSIPLAESLIHVGRRKEAGALLARVFGEMLMNPSLVATAFNLHERLSRPDALRQAWPAVCRLAGRGNSVNLEQFFWMHFYAGKLKDGLTHVTQPDFGQGYGTGFPIRAAFLLWLGRFDAAAACLRERGYAGKGPSSVHRLLLGTMVHLANGDIKAVLSSYREILLILDVQGSNLDTRWPPLLPIFEYLLVLRHIGRLEDAAATALHYARRYDVAGNPCRPLLTLFKRELGQPDVSLEEEAEQCEQAADELDNPRSYCQGWLYLQAAVTRIKLGQYVAADRILQTKLATVLFLDPVGRQSLRTVDSRELGNWRMSLQRMFFPHFSGKYWNRLLDDMLEPIMECTAGGNA